MLGVMHALYVAKLACNGQLLSRQGVAFHGQKLCHANSALILLQWVPGTQSLAQNVIQGVQEVRPCACQACKVQSCGIVWNG